MNPFLLFALAADATFYLGTYMKVGKSKGNYAGKLDKESGKRGLAFLLA